MRNLKLYFSGKIAGCFIITLLILAGQSYGGDKDMSTNPSTKIQLKKEMAKIGSGQENPALIKKLRIDVARSGDETERKKIREELNDKDAVRQSGAIEMAKSVGGPDMIAGLAGLLSDTNSYRSIDVSGHPEGRNVQGDVVLEPPRIVAAKALSELVENPPVPPIGKDKKYYTDEDVLVWQKWWQQKKSKLKIP